MARFVEFRNHLTSERLRELLTYNPDTGGWFWRVQYAGCRAGERAGYLRKGRRGNKDRWIIRIGGKNYFGHVLAWVYMTGEWPAQLIDHENNIGDDNRWTNLRLATKSQNGANSKLYRNNTSGFKGVTFNKQKQKYVAEIRLGCFDTAEEAGEAYMAAAKQIHGEFARAK